MMMFEWKDTQLGRKISLINCSRPEIQEKKTSLTCKNKSFFELRQENRSATVAGFAESRDGNLIEWNPRYDSQVIHYMNVAFSRQTSHFYPLLLFSEWNHFDSWSIKVTVFVLCWCHQPSSYERVKKGVFTYLIDCARLEKYFCVKKFSRRRRIDIFRGDEQSFPTHHNPLNLYHDFPQRLGLINFKRHN